MLRWVGVVLQRYLDSALRKFRIKDERLSDKMAGLSDRPGVFLESRVGVGQCKVWRGKRTEWNRKSVRQHRVDVGRANPIPFWSAGINAPGRFAPSKFGFGRVRGMSWVTLSGYSPKTVFRIAQKFYFVKRLAESCSPFCSKIKPETLPLAARSNQTSALSG